MFICLWKSLFHHTMIALQPTKIYNTEKERSKTSYGIKLTNCILFGWRKSIPLLWQQSLKPCVMTFLARCIGKPAQLSVCLSVCLCLYNCCLWCVSIQGVMQVERRLGGFLLDKPRQMLFHFTAANLCVSIEDFSPGWRCKQNANYQVSHIPACRLYRVPTHPYSVLFSSMLLVLSFINVDFVWVT